MQVQAPPTFASPGAPAYSGDLHPGGLFDAFYEATAPIAFDFASGLAARSDDAAAIVTAAYEDVWSANERSGVPYHVVPLLADVYAKSVGCPRPGAHATRPGVDAVAALSEPHKSVLRLSERHRFSPEDVGAILGIGPEDVRRARDDARMVVHGVSAALALCPDGVAACPDLAAIMNPTMPVVAQTEAILDHAERCAYCSQAALASPDPIKELRYGTMPNGQSGPPSGGPAAPAAANGQPRAGLVGAPLAGAAAAAAVWSAAPAGAAPLPGPAPSLAAKAAPADKAWAPMRLWNKATGWQKSGAIVAVLLIVALVIAIAAGGDSEDVAARTNPNGSGTTPQGSVSSSPPPIATIPSTTTTGPVTTTVEQTPSTAPPSTQPHTSGSSSGGSNASGGSTSGPSATAPATTEPTTTTTTAPPPPPPVIQSAGWGQFPFKDPNTGKYSVPFVWTSTGTSSSWTTTWGATGSVQLGDSVQLFSSVPSGSHSITLNVTDANGTTTQEFPLTLP